MRPKEYKHIKLGMSNLENEIDEGFEEALKTQLVCGNHSAWNFFGDVYYKDGWFYEDVWVYHSFIETITAKSLKELMRDVNLIYGFN